MNNPVKDFRAVIMCGISGSGKTRFARRLESEGFIRLSTDSLIWDKVGTRLTDFSPEERKKLFAEQRQEVNRQLRHLLKTDRKVVVDATHCRRSARDEVRKICSEAGVTPIFIYCHADKDVLWQRLSQRKGLGPDDLIVTFEELSGYWLGFERPDPDENDFILP